MCACLTFPISNLSHIVLREGRMRDACLVFAFSYVSTVMECWHGVTSLIPSLVPHCVEGGQAIWVVLAWLMQFPMLSWPLPLYLQIHCINNVLWNHGPWGGQKKTHGGENIGLLLLRLALVSTVFIVIICALIINIYYDILNELKGALSWNHIDVAVPGLCTCL